MRIVYDMHVLVFKKGGLDQMPDWSYYIYARSNRNVFHALKHAIIDCVDVADVHQTFYNVNTLSDLFTNVACDTIFKF